MRIKGAQPGERSWRSQSRIRASKGAPQAPRGIAVPEFRNCCRLRVLSLAPNPTNMQDVTELPLLGETFMNAQAASSSPMASRGTALAALVGGHHALRVRSFKQVNKKNLSTRIPAGSCQSVFSLRCTLRSEVTLDGQILCCVGGGESPLIYPRTLTYCESVLSWAQTGASSWFGHTVECFSYRHTIQQAASWKGVVWQRGDTHTTSV